ncbi:MAG: aminotransferase class V-fold PLP-dependent enzyme [Spirochaetales bacterium]|nr:aminotransferase class V-fold PLP-dependent enzyme [Spirochaetales bacterium]
MEAILGQYPRLVAFAERLLALFPFLEKALKKLPAVKREMQAEQQKATLSVEHTLKPYDPGFLELPGQGVAPTKLKAQMRERMQKENPRWQKGLVSGGVYHGQKEHIDFLNEIYAMHSQTNPLHVDLWPSITRYENEITSMTANLLGKRESQADIVGSVTSGGTESILLAMKTYRDHAREVRGIRHGEMIVPETAHAAFDKAAMYFGIKKRTVPVGADMRADVRSVRRALSSRTIVVVGSAPSFPHGVIDPIAEMSELARRAGAGFHTDACLGGFVLPFARELGYSAPDFDFRLPGVTSLSADTHKFGYAAKGTSVVLYRSASLREHQFYITTDWPGGLYFSPTLAGSRPGALIAQCRAAMLRMGRQGYQDAARRIFFTARKIKEGLADIEGLELLGDSLFVIAFKSKDLNIYNISERLGRAGWNLNGLHRPACLHLCVTLLHTQKGVAGRFLKDLKIAVQAERKAPLKSAGMAPVYGMAAALPARGIVRDLLRAVLDRIYRP